MHYVWITLALHILDPKLPSAGAYLVIDVDGLKQLELNQGAKYKDAVPVARRHTENKNDVLKTKQFLKTAIETLQSYNDDELRDVINSFKNSLTNMNSDNKHFLKAKNFVLAKLSQTSGKSGKQIKKLLDIMYKALDNNENSDVIRHDTGIFQQLMNKLLNGAERNRAQDTDVLETIKTALQRVISGLVFSHRNKAEENSILKFAEKIWEPDVSAENADFFIDNEQEKKKKPIAWLKNKAMNVALDLFNEPKKSTIEGQVDFKLDGMGDDNELKLTF